MTERMKMPRSKRAAQFAPFDALKGLQDALRLKEYEHARIQKGEVSEETAIEISAILLNLEKPDIVRVKYYDATDEHYHEARGMATLRFEEGLIIVHDLSVGGGIKIKIDDIYEIENTSKPNTI